MPPTPDDPLQTPQESDSESSSTANTANPKVRPGQVGQSKSPLSSVPNLPYRRSNASLSHLFQSTTSLPAAPIRSDSDSGTVTPAVGIVNGSVFSPGGPARTDSSSASTVPGQPLVGETKDLILRAFAPHVSVLASQDTEELIRHKGIDGGLLELLRPFGEHVQGKVTIRDSSGASRSWDDMAIRFTGVKDGLEKPRVADRRSTDSAATQPRNGHQRLASLEFRPARLRSGGDVAQIEELVERHLTFAEEQSGPVQADYFAQQQASARPGQPEDSPFYMLYLRRLLSGMPMVPSETLSHPVATVIAISSRSASPIEELRNLFASSNTGEHRLPQWVLNEFLRYYVLIHDEDHDDIQKSMALFDQMKRHFGLHCHLLRLRSAQCVPSDDDSRKLPHSEWTSAAEELAEIVRREADDDDDQDPTPCIFESDAAAVRAFVREMVTQSIVPSMERASATWNEQVASRRRGLSGRFMSLSKRITTFGGGRSSTPTLGGAGNGNGNYDSLQGFYRPDAPEAIMRRLADYSLMLRDFRLAQGTLEILCQDYKSDKAWRHYAAANEMAAVSALLASGSAMSAKARTDTVDQYLETAHYSYITRAGSPFHALRSLLLAGELLKLRGGSALDDAARWLGKAVEDRLVGPVGHALLLERVASCFAQRQGVGALHSGQRRRKAAFWTTLAADAWLQLDKTEQAERALAEAECLYDARDADAPFDGVHRFLASLRDAIRANRAGPQPMGAADDAAQVETDEQTSVEPLQERQEQSAPAVGHRHSVSTASARLREVDVASDPLGAVPETYQQETGTTEQAATPRLDRERERERRDDGFE